MRNLDTSADYRDAAREMADSGRPTLARLLAEEAAERATDPDESAHLLTDFPGRSLRKEG